MNTATLPADRLACLLRDAANGMTADMAAVDLICSHGHFLHHAFSEHLLNARIDPALKFPPRAGQKKTGWERFGYDLKRRKWHSGLQTNFNGPQDAPWVLQVDPRVGLGV